MSQSAKTAPVESTHPNAVRWGRELMASLVVFCVALPLCMGIAIASGVPPALGLVTGIVGGIVVGLIAGSPLQVSGPAASLSVLVFDLVQAHGIGALGIAIVVVGLLQFVAGVLKLGQWFRAVSPAVIQGLLAGIGVIIAASQIHVMLDRAPESNALQNLLRVPTALMAMIGSSQQRSAALIAVVTIAAIALWNRYRPARFKVVPGALVGVLLGTVLANVLGLAIRHVDVPRNLFGALTLPSWSSVSLLTDFGFIGSVLAIALMASTATLLCATAVDRLHDGVRTDYDKELRAQGVGNMLCGFVGALPITGVIVRSSANVEAGAQTRWPAVIHGVLILFLVVALPVVLSWIPIASLAAILVYTGFRLAHPSVVRAVAQTGRGELLVFVATVVCIVSFSLTVGMVVGFALALAKVLYGLMHLEIDTVDGEGRVDIGFHGALTFIKIPKLTAALEKVAHGLEVHIHVGGLAYIDHACMEVLRDFQKAYGSRGGEVLIEWDEIEVRKGRLLTRTKEFSDPEIVSDIDTSTPGPAALG